MNFADLGLPEALCRVLQNKDINEPTPVQEQAIPLALAGKDVIASAKTGTGKTYAFALPLVTKLMNDPKGIALVLVPTRELAAQVHSVLQALLQAADLSAPCLLIGGVSFGPQIASLRRKPRVLIATPGRLLDHLRQGQWRLPELKILVLDEADRMLDMGFMPQVKGILEFLTGERQTMLFTATLPKEIRQVCNRLMQDPEEIFVDPPSTANTNIEQKMQLVEDQDQKNDALLEALQNQQESVLVFARTKRRTDRVATYLQQYGVEAERIHGDRSQAQRQKAIASFRRGQVRILVATDIAARGLDIPSVELVVNFDLPEVREDYVHRIGRTGRAGATGEALSLVLPEEEKHWSYLQGERNNPALPPRQRGGGKPQQGGRRGERSDRGERRGERGERSGRGFGFKRGQENRRDSGARRKDFENRGFAQAEASESARPESRPENRRERREKKFGSSFGKPARTERSDRPDRGEKRGWGKPERREPRSGFRDSSRAPAPRWGKNKESNEGRSDRGGYFDQPLKRRDRSERPQQNRSWGQDRPERQDRGEVRSREKRPFVKDSAERGSGGFGRKPQRKGSSWGYIAGKEKKQARKGSGHSHKY